MNIQLFLSPEMGDIESPLMHEVLAITRPRSFGLVHQLERFVTEDIDAQP
jgi:hypothetical protein